MVWWTCCALIANHAMFSSLWLDFNFGQTKIYWVSLFMRQSHIKFHLFALQSFATELFRDFSADLLRFVFFRWTWILWTLCHFDLNRFHFIYFFDFIHTNERPQFSPQKCRLSSLSLSARFAILSFLYCHGCISAQNHVASMDWRTKILSDRNYWKNKNRVNYGLHSIVFTKIMIKRIDGKMDRIRRAIVCTSYLFHCEN